MRSFEEQLTEYAKYHRDHRNIATHFIGIPMIVLGIMILLSKPLIPIGDLIFTPAVFIALASCIYYLSLNVAYGIAMSVLFSLLLTVAIILSSYGQTVWLSSGIGLFLVGWIAQFIGHFYEGKKPAFVDDLIGLIIGPLFIVVEASFILGINKSLELSIDSAAGARR